MQITPIRILEDSTRFGLGTGKDKGKEVYPTTKTLLTKLKLNPLQMGSILVLQDKTLDELPDYETINKLRSYQKEDVKFLAARKTAGCFNEQRTGKTPTALSVMKVKDVCKLLIIAPASTLYNWQSECHNWWFTELPAIVVTGTAKKREKLIKDWDKGALIISYECLREVNHVVKDERGDIVSIYDTGDLSLIKKHKDIEGVILDEAHRIKNHKSKQAQALFDLKYIPNRLALTGTPAPGKQHEIYSILHWLYPKIFTGYWRFVDYYFQQIEEWDSNGTHKVIGGFKQGKAAELQDFLNVISTRRLRSSVMDWLPEKDREVIHLPLTKEQASYIKELDETFEIANTDIDASSILAKLIKIRQLCLTPALLDLKGGSPKLDWIKQYLKDYPEKNVIIFSNFTRWLKYLSKELKCNNLIIGETSKKERENLKQLFQTGKIHLLLINIKAGKEGITLDNADTTIFTDKYPPIGDILQAEDRFVATTKDKINTGHLIIDLVMKDSYEENILNMLKQNASEVDIINNYIKYLKDKN